MAGRPKELDSMTPLGRLIAEQCDLRGLTLADLSEQIGWRVDKMSHFCRRESVTVAEVRAVAAALGLDVAKLIALDSRRAS